MDEYNNIKYSSKGILLLYIHIVSKGETLSSIAGKYNQSKNKIASENNLDDLNKLIPGQNLPNIQQSKVVFFMKDMIIQFWERS